MDFHKYIHLLNYTDPQSQIQNKENTSIKTFT